MKDERLKKYTFTLTGSRKGRKEMRKAHKEKYYFAVLAFCFAAFARTIRLFL